MAWTSWAAFTTPAIRIPVDDLDTTPPAPPAAVTLSSTPGELIASWAADAADVIYSELEITEAGGNAVLFQTSGTRYRWAPVFSGVSYTVRRRAVDRLGNKSAWSNPATHVVAADTIPPATPTGLVLTSGVKSIWLRWNANTGADLSHYEIRQENATFTPNAATPATYTVTANNYLVPDIGYATQRWFAVRAVDTSGNKSGWTAVANAITAVKDAVTTTDLAGVVNATSFATGVEPVTIHTGITLDRTSTGRSRISWAVNWPVGSRVVFDWVTANPATGVWCSLDDALGLSTPTHDLMRNVSGGGEHVDFTVPAAGYAYFGFSVSNGQATDLLTISQFAVHAP